MFFSSTKANKALGIVRNTFTRPSRVTMKKLYCYYVRQHLELAVAVWSPGMKYKERLDVFELPKLEQPRERVWNKFEMNIKKINWLKSNYKNGIYEKKMGPVSGLRRQPVRYCPERTRSNTRGQFFKNRVLSNWNLK